MLIKSHELPLRKHNKNCFIEGYPTKQCCYLSCKTLHSVIQQQLQQQQQLGHQQQLKAPEKILIKKSHHGESYDKNEANKARSSNWCWKRTRCREGARHPLLLIGVVIAFSIFSIFIYIGNLKKIQYSQHVVNLFTAVKEDMLICPSEPKDLDFPVGFPQNLTFGRFRKEGMSNLERGRPYITQDCWVDAVDNKRTFFLRPGRRFYQDVSLSYPNWHWTACLKTYQFGL